MSDRVEGNRQRLKGIHMDSESNPWKGNIPIDLVSDILSRLPAKAVGRCMCTCKKWYSLVKSAQFITSHLNRSKLRDHSVLIVQEGCYSTFSESDSILIEQERGRIPFTVMERDLYIFGSCRGLVLVRLKVERGWVVLLWNPSLEKFKLIDTIVFDGHLAHAPTSWLRVFALGFDEASNDYRVVRMDRTSPNIYLEVDVYSLRRDSWHRVNGTLTNGKRLPIIMSPGKMANYVNGAVHWLAKYDMQEHYMVENDPFVILSFDFGNEVFRLIELPKRYGYYNHESHALELNELNGKLVLFGGYPDPCEFYFTWVMMNYPLVESWTCRDCLFEHKVKYGTNAIRPMVCTKKENCIFKDIRLVKRDMLRYYNAKEDEIYELEVVAPYNSPVIVDFVDCLVLLDAENEVLDDHAP